MQTAYAFPNRETDEGYSALQWIANHHRTHTLTIETQVIQAEIAATPAERQQGLMFRPSLKPGTGMLFIFEINGFHCFWMKNTSIPLSIAFIDKNGIITDIDAMQAHSAQKHCPSRRVRYALEMPIGWFAAHHIRPGSKVEGVLSIDENR